jgi:hypothetical protein
MRWLHFSDFHFKSSPGAQDDAMLSLMVFLRSICKGLPIDAVILAGDLSYSGTADEFARFEELFLLPLFQIPEVKDARIFSVPGNHDVDCEASDPITWEGIKPRKQAIYFQESEVGIRAREQRSRVFTHYSNFVQRHRILSPDAKNEVSSFFSTPDFPVDFICANTSFFCDREEDSSAAITPCPLPSINNRLQRQSQDRPALLIGHHPINCFLPKDQLPFENLLLDRKLIYLHGHEHSPKFSCNFNGTVRSVGFGASYIVTLGMDSQAPYRNSFTLCELSQELHVSSFTWDSRIGRWEDSTRYDFSNGFTSGNKQDKLTLQLPGINRSSIKQPGLSVAPPLAEIPRKPPQVRAVAIVSPPTDRVWVKLLNLSNIVKLYKSSTESPQFIAEGDGKAEFMLEEQDNRDLIVCIPGASHVLSAKEIESYNTRLDTEGLRSVSIISIGKISTDANVMYTRLRTRKNIEVLVNKDICAQAQILITPSQASYLSKFDSAEIHVDLLLSRDEVFLLALMTTPSPWFEVVDSKGEIVSSTHEVVVALRDGNSALAKLPYSDSSRASDEITDDGVAFDEDAYLENCYRENNVMKYAALANVGLRFTDFSLDKVYIDGSASEVESTGSERLDNLLDDHLAPYPASDKLKQQIKQQFLSHHELNESRETSQAREYCQKFGALLLTGDPGSGKTCFVKSEMLAYSRRSTRLNFSPDSESWHSQHVPLMVQLSQVAAENDLMAVGLLGIASRLLERRGTKLPTAVLEDLLAQGRLALFFDGLDEVVSVEKRAMVVQKINELIAAAIPKGNRFVVTSRPAAVNVVNLLPALRKVELQGLGETEIATLIKRILSLRLSDTEGGVVVDEQSGSNTDGSIVNKILQDCREKPGVARLAQNPLLLTLLVMIYANSGAPSAKRHRIYEEAIRTLATVRGRQTGHDPVSAQDLRERLGAVALSVYRKESGILPTRTEVTEVIRTVMEKQVGRQVPQLDSEKFIQKVAESTGLIAFSGDEGVGGGLITFMHHSFMEYFAAVGLSKELDKLDLKQLVKQPRWLEILTLLAGIIGENADIAPILTRIIGNGGEYGDVDANLLIFAIDCALECEVPSEAALQLILRSVELCIEKGPARCDAWVRSEIGHRLEQLVSSCGLTVFEDVFVKLLRISDPDSCAAAISVVSFACAGDNSSNSIVSAIENCCTRNDEQVLCAICEAASRVKRFQTPVVTQTLSRCFRKSNRLKIAAFEAVSAIPTLVREHWADIINGLDDNSSLVRRLASRAAIQAGLDGDLASAADSKKDVVANAFQIINESFPELESQESKVRQDTVERLLLAPSLKDKLIGIQLLPSCQGTAEFIHKSLFGLIGSSNDHREVCAALWALRSSRAAQSLVTLVDLKQIVERSTDGTSDIRRAAIILLAQFSLDATAVKGLLARDFESLSSSEFSAAMFSLGKSQCCQAEVQAFFENTLSGMLSTKAKRNAQYEERMCSILDAAVELGKNLSKNVASALYRLIGDFKEPESVRRASLRAYVATAVPSLKLVDFLVECFVKCPGKMTEELVQTPSILARNCRQSVDYVVACVDGMSRLQQSATELHSNLQKRRMTDDLQLMISSLRDGIAEISQIIVTFEEFVKST